MIMVEAVGEILVLECPVCEYQMAVRKGGPIKRPHTKPLIRGLPASQQPPLSDHAGHTKRATNGRKGDVLDEGYSNLFAKEWDKKRRSKT